MQYNSEKAVSICINGKKIANVTSVVSTFHREKKVVDGALQNPGPEMQVVIRRERPIGSPCSDLLNLRTLSGFTLDIYTPWSTETYTVCQWLDFKQEILPDNKVAETMTVASLNYTITA